MASPGDDYLRSVLGDDQASTPSEPSNVTGGGSAPGSGGQTMDEIQAEIDRAREAERGRVADGEQDGGWFSGISQAMASTNGGSSGGGYRFSPEQIDANIRHFEGIRDRILENRDELRRAAALATPPSPDPPAVAQAKAARESLERAADQCHGMFQYAQGYVDALRKANGTYVQQDEDTAGVFKKKDDGGDAQPGTGKLFQ